MRMTTNKIKFEVVELMVQDIFREGKKDEETLSEFLERVDDFITSCGWDVDEYEKRKYSEDIN